VRYFLGRDNEVVATFHTFPHYLHQVDGAHPVRLDLADGDAIEEVVARHRPSLILHAAALARPQESGDYDSLHTVNVLGAEALSAAAARYDSPIVYLSTDLVYGADAGLCDESTPVRPSGAGAYSTTKLQGEEAVRSTATRWIVIRPSLMFGDGVPRSNSFTQFIDRCWERGEAAPLFTDQFRSFLYVGDLLRAIESAVTADAWNELYVCGGAERMSRAEFGLRYADATGTSRSLCRTMRANELPGYVGGGGDITLDTSKLQRLGWRAMTIDEAFAAMRSERS
jgi:dTDP-4-dehydrorhamnose reductase